MIWPSDLLFDPIWPIFGLRDFVKDNIVSKFQLDKAINVVFRAVTRVFYDLIQWPTYKSHMTQF